MSKHLFRKCTFVHMCFLAMAMLLCIPASGVNAAPASQENLTVSGVVTSAADQLPLIGVSVQVKGTSNGAITDLDGNYTVTVQPGQTLVFSYIGFVTQEVEITNQRTLNIVMNEDSETLEEVVVVGYGVQKKKLVTGATVQVKGETLAKMNTNSPLQAMQGQTPGVNISSTSGQPGESMKVSIRGLGTVGNAEPLYLIDGVGGDISTLNPADIESIDVLKDAASAAIYGAQAANGVVLITTKSGKAGKAQISFDAYYGWQTQARKADMLNAQEYMMIMDEQAVNSGNAPYDWSSYESIYDANGNVYDTDWVNSMFQNNAQTQSYTLGITGGSETSTYAMSLGYMSQEGIVGGKDVSNYERYNFRINSEHKLFKDSDLLKVGEQVSFVYKMNNGISVGNQYNNTLRGAFGTSPLAPIYSDNNIYDSPYNDTTNSDWYNADGNPYGSMMTNSNNENKDVTFSGNVYAELQPVKNLKFRTVFGAVYSTNEYRSFSPLYQFSIYSFNNTRTSAAQNMSHGLTMTWTNTATYDWTVGEHAFNALLGMEISRYNGTYLRATNGILRDGFDDWDHAYVDNGTATSTDNGLGAAGHPNDETRTVSYFARFGWNWKETYMINATVRTDGSSRFARGNRYGVFPSVSAGWTISNEAFMEDTHDWLDFLKLRVSWGQVGNQNIDNYQYTAPITSSNTHYLFGNQVGADAQSGYWGAYPSRLANEDVTWETSEQTNIGIDARFLRSRLSLTADFYIKKTKDWLVEAPILATAGTGAPYINGGDVKNTGIELALTWNDQIGSDFQYNVGVNGAYNKNKVGNIPTEDGIIHGDVNMLYDNTPEFYRASNGHPIGYFWGYQTAGIFQNKQQIEDWRAAGNGILQADVQPGDVIYVDQDHNGIIDDNDKVDLGNGTPDFTYGFNLGFSYKNFDFALNAYGAAGNQIVQSYRNHANSHSNYTSAILERWTGEGTSNRIPRVTETNINWQFSDLYIQDGDYLRISNITIGYDFAKLINLKAISQARLYFQVQNAFTFTKYDGMDPEIGYGTSDWVSGIDLGYYPRPRTFLVGVNLKF
ncbi:TonB-dependent receptor plug [Phocaeicola salanitronis DSM 18170]|uniref:TonB-dependent receptor plug n=1 Tax=Phocaeicola salanitronis (strain DSM 18170 / JCM 13657 / CCUG 60908 / BL78) TaxID=667015 RepID=F0R2T6_PHOSB|nr:TonB-dependent receptor [Phocaeicola salanitronis]ADY35481.1 TonB-dependent receptor plug [Phocaeicola salanitronis DSM 18170]